MPTDAEELLLRHEMDEVDPNHAMRVEAYHKFINDLKSAARAGLIDMDPDLPHTMTSGFSPEFIAQCNKAAEVTGYPARIIAAAFLILTNDDRKLHGTIGGCPPPIPDSGVAALPRRLPCATSAKIDRAAQQLGDRFVTEAAKIRARTPPEMVRQLVEIQLLPPEAVQALELFNTVTVTTRP